MAKSTKTTVKISELIAQSEAARLQLGKSHTELKRKLDVPTRLRESFKAQPTKWLGGFAAAGLAGSFLFRSKKKPQKISREIKKAKKQRGMLISALLLVAKLSKPVVKIYATKLLKDFLQNQISRGRIVRPTSQKSPFF